MSPIEAYDTDALEELAKQPRLPDNTLDPYWTARAMEFLQQRRDLARTLLKISGEDIEVEGWSLDNWLRAWFCGDHAFRQVLDDLPSSPQFGKCLVCRLEAAEAALAKMRAVLDRIADEGQIHSCGDECAENMRDAAREALEASPGIGSGDTERGR